MKFLNKIMLLSAGFVCAAQANEISITNTLSQEMPVTVTFAVSKTAKATRPAKKRILYNQTASFDQPIDKDWVTITVYHAGGYKTVKIQRSFSLKNPLFDNSRAITIEGVSSTPTLWLNGKELEAVR
ncbi:hypothetical protein JST99_01280 [Candidatus Dependentiae bacterium]|nr:hypothetical protein [Candidatus Dependentiae bacterium]